MLTVVLVDDEYYFRQAMKRYLSEWQDEYCLVGEAKNGKEGLEIIRQQRPDIVLMDINMQIMSGLDAMKVLAEENVPSKVILVTGYSEFEYAHQAIRFGVFDYLLKPLDKEDLRKCLDQAAVQIKSERRYKELQMKYYSASFKVKEHFVNRIFSAKNENDWAEVERMAGDILNPENSFSYQAFLVNILAEEENQEKNDPVDFFTISNVLSELLERKGIQCFMSSDNNTLKGVVSGTLQPEELEDTAYEIYSSSRDIIHKLIGQPIFISVGTSRGRLREIEVSVQEASRVQKFMRMYRKCGVCTSARLKLRDEKAGQFFGDLYTQLILFIRTNNAEAMEELITKFFDEMREREEQPEIVLQSASNMISCANDVLQKYLIGIKNDRPEAEEDNELLKRPKFEEDSIERIQTKVLAYIREVMQLINERRTKNKSSLSSRVAQYIEQNCQRYDLSLMELSATFGMSKTILCQQFKDAFGITIGDHILKCRMKKAVEMMDEGYRNVAFVAEKCGYEDAGYFSKCFKKYFGVSPKDYCETHSDGR